jgi:hypothetical protein
MKVILDEAHIQAFTDLCSSNRAVYDQFTRTVNARWRHIYECEDQEETKRREQIAARRQARKDAVDIIGSYLRRSGQLNQCGAISNTQFLRHVDVCFARVPKHGHAVCNEVLRRLSNSRRSGDTVRRSEDRKAWRVLRAKFAGAF